MSYLKHIIAYGLTVALASACNTHTSVGPGGAGQDGFSRFNHSNSGNPAY